MRELEVVIGKEGKYRCKCGEERFKIFDTVYDEMGEVGFRFICECGELYQWVYGEVGKEGGV